MSINAITSAWTPPEVKATDLTDTDSAKEQAENASKVPTTDPAGKEFEVSRPIKGAELASQNVTWDDSGNGAISGLWSNCKTIGDFFTALYGKNTGLNPNFIPTKDINKSWIG